MAEQRRERVIAEVVWVASIGRLDCESRSITHHTTSNHDTEGDARRWMVANGLFERTDRWGCKWRDDGGFAIGSVTRTIRELNDQPDPAPTSPLSAQRER